MRRAAVISLIVCASLPGVPLLVVSVWYFGRLGLLLLAVATLGMLLSLPWAFKEVREQETKDRREQGRCLKCGYDLRAHRAGDRCPECGTTAAIVPRDDAFLFGRAWKKNAKG
jgi:hypothetical protein